jgi:hypothetical protein
LKIVKNIDEFLVQLNQFNLKLGDEFKVFEPYQTFMNHMIYMGYSVAFENTFLFEEEEVDSESPRVLPIQRNQ